MNLFSLHVLDVRSHRFFHQTLLEVLWSLRVTRGVPGVVRGLLIGAVLAKFEPQSWEVRSDYGNALEGINRASSLP